MIVLRTVLSCRPDAPCGSSESSCSSAERARLPARKERRSDSSSARTAGAGATPKCGRARNELVDEPRRQHAMPPSSHHRDASKSGSVTRPAATFSVGRAPAVPRAAASTTTRAKGACELRKQLHGAPTPRRRADAARRSVASTDSSSDRDRAWRDRRWPHRPSVPDLQDDASGISGARTDYWTCMGQPASHCGGVAAGGRRACRRQQAAAWGAAR